MGLHKRVALLDRTRHGGLKVRPINFAFAAEQQTAPLTGAEFMACAADHPIVFVTDQKQGVFPVALLSLQRGRNVHVAADGNWDASYIPAFFRQYPFILSENDSICFDEASDALSKDVGEPLFKGEANAPKLDQTIAFLSQYRAAAKQTASVCEKISDLDILKPWALEISREGGAPVTVKGFSVVNEDRLSVVRLNLLDRIDPAAMGWIYAHLVSLSNFKKLGTHLSAPTAKKARTLN